MLSRRTLLILVCFAVAVPCLSSDPQLAGGFPVTNGSSPLITDRDSYPVVANWNNDGKKDLVIGYRSTENGCNAGKFRAYTNQNTDAIPGFNGYSILSSLGADISLPNSGG
jgi:hypothetical protein